MRMPPCSRLVQSVLKNPDRLVRFSGCTRERASIWLATGPDAWGWQEAHPRHLCIVLPIEEDPLSYRWGFLQGHEPILITGPASQDAAQRRAIAAAFFRDGVERVLAGSVLMLADTQARAA